MSKGIIKGFNPNRNTKKREFVIEDYLKEKVESAGGKCYKFISSGYDGMPDRIILFHGTVVFVETKRPGKKPRKLQEIRLKEIKKQGVPALCISTKEQVDDLIHDLVTGGHIHV